MSPRATLSQASTAEGNKKRNLDEPNSQSSPLRRSKRVRSDEADQLLPSPSRREKANGAVHGGKSSDLKHTGKAPVKEEVVEDEKESIVITKTGKGAKAVAVKKTSKKTTKSKENKQQEAMPLKPRTQGLRMFVGAHVSAAGGVFNAVQNSTHIGGNAFALFLKSQRKWDNPPLQDEHRDQFRQLCLEHKYDAAKYVLPHGSYLVNLAQEDKAKAKQAYDSFLDDLRRCEALGVTLYNFHPGSANQTTPSSALTRLAKALTDALTATKTVIPVLETMCGHGTTIGGSLREFQALLALIPAEHHPRIGICIDTCHSFAAGYDLTSPVGFRAFMQEFEDVVGLRHLRALHLNDSKAPGGSKRDLHANIGTGFLGLRAFHNVMNEPRLEGIPMILETPIDRPQGQVKEVLAKNKSKKKEEDDDEEGCGSAHDDDDDDDDLSASDSGKAKKAKPKAKKPASAGAGGKARMIQDFSIWAREIKLLESLIGMDPESDEFQTLEAELSEEGREMRAKQQEQYDRKLEAEEKKKKKGTTTAAKKGQKSLMDMMKGAVDKKK